MKNLARKLSSFCPARLRLAAENLSRGRVLRRCLGPEFSQRMLYVTPEASLVFLDPLSHLDLGEDLLTFCREFVQTGAVVWDLGGNVGLFSFAASVRAGETGFVLAAEPDPFLSQLMVRTESVRPAGCAPCTIVTAAVGRQAGFATLEVPERSRASNALAGKSRSSQRGLVRQHFDVPVVTIDQLASAYPPPQVLKIDIEGSELDALVGGERTLRQSRPVMLLEVQRHHAGAVRDLLKGWNYHLHDPLVPRAERVDLADLTYNTLAVPF